MSSAAQISEAQLKANRENATRSTGPRTEAGKNRARLNGLRHGLAGHTVVMPYEDRAQYDAFVAQTIESLQPESEAERALAASIADDHWRLNRARAIEENIFALGSSQGDDILDAALNQAQTFLNDGRQIALLSLYEQRIHRTLKNKVAELNRLQSERKAARERALEEAMLLFQLNESKGDHYDPAMDGFGYSAAEIARRVDRSRRLQQAKALFQPSSKHFSRRPQGRRAA
jgi:DNA primase